jgi:hypothetical protein
VKDFPSYFALATEMDALRTENDKLSLRLSDIERLVGK